MVFMKGHKISFKIFQNLQILTFAFSVIVQSNFEVLPVETPLILCGFPFMKLLINKCYDWYSKISHYNMHCFHCGNEFSQKKVLEASKPRHTIFV